MNKLAHTGARMNDRTAARVLEEEVLAIRKRVFGAEDEKTVEAVNSLAKTLDNLGCDDEAVALRAQAQAQAIRSPVRWKARSSFPNGPHGEYYCTLAIRREPPGLIADIRWNNRFAEKQIEVVTQSIRQINEQADGWTLDLIGNDDMLRLVAATDLDRTQMFEEMIDGPIDAF